MFFPLKAIAAFSEASYSDEYDFVESLIYANDKWVLMKGVLVDKPDETVGNVNKIGAYYKQWFFKHVERFLNEPDIQLTEFVRDNTANSPSPPLCHLVLLGHW